MCGAAVHARFFLALAAALAAAAAGLAAPPRARADESSLADELTPDAEVAIGTGLGYLLTLQDEQTGQFGTDYPVASTSLAGLALLASGDVWNRGLRAVAVNRAVHYLLNVAMKQTDSGLVYFLDGKEDQGTMHSHGFAMLFLAECYGTTERDDDIKRALHGAIQASLGAQTSLGGWGYYFRWDHRWNDDEASVTITQIQALRACRNAGFAIPASRIDRAVEYVRQSMTPEGSCRYSLTMGGPERFRTSFELTAAAVSTLNASGVYDSPELARGLAFLRKSLAAVDSPGKAATDFYFYGNFYAGQAMFQAGGADWASWYPAMRRELLQKQRPSGGWEDPRNFGNAYATASALLILQLPKRYLPIFAE